MPGRMYEIPKYYSALFNGVTDAIEAFQHFKYSTGLNLLIAAQQKAEDLFMEAAEAEEKTFRAEAEADDGIWHPEGEEGEPY